MENVKKLANEILKNQLEEGEKIIVSQIEKSIYYASINTTRIGPGSVIIGEDLSYLWGSSVFCYSKLLELYKNGKRTTLNK